MLLDSTPSTNTIEDLSNGSFLRGSSWVRAMAACVSHPRLLLLASLIFIAVIITSISFRIYPTSSVARKTHSIRAQQPDPRRHAQKDEHNEDDAEELVVQDYTAVDSPNPAPLHVTTPLHRPFSTTQRVIGVIIASAGRTGSTLLCQYFANHANTFLLAEPDRQFFFKYV